jgi:hypothetical protein
MATNTAARISDSYERLPTFIRSKETSTLASESGRAFFYKCSMPAIGIIKTSGVRKRQNDRSDKRNQLPQISMARSQIAFQIEAVTIGNSTCDGWCVSW